MDVRFVPRNDEFSLDSYIYLLRVYTYASGLISGTKPAFEV